MNEPYDMPPLDRDMIARARERRERGETGESIEDLIQRLGGTIKGSANHACWVPGHPDDCQCGGKG